MECFCLLFLGFLVTLNVGEGSSWQMCLTWALGGSLILVHFAASFNKADRAYKQDVAALVERFNSPTLLADTENFEFLTARACTQSGLDRSPCSLRLEQHSCRRSRVCVCAPAHTSSLA